MKKTNLETEYLHARELLKLDATINIIEIRSVAASPPDDVQVQEDLE